MKTTLRLAPVLLLLALATPSFAVSKEMVQLQTQVQELQDAIARLQQSNDERMGVMKDLVTQTADSVNKMTAVVQSLQKQMAAQQEAQNGKLDQASGQVQSLNDSLDELKTRLARIEKSISDIQNQQQSISANLQSGTPSGSAPPQSGQPATQDNVSPPTDQPASPAPVVRKKPAAGVPLSEVTGGDSPASSAPPVGDLYKTALGDYMGARYALATAEFGDVIKFYPDDTLSGNSLYYLGEIDYRAAKYSNAVKSYDKLIAQYPDSNKVPAARLHKGQALISLNQKDAGVRELRLLIQRFPNSPEATQARSRLSGMGILVTPRH